MNITELRNALEWISACLRGIDQAANARGADLTDVTERTAAVALTSDEEARWNEGTAEIERLKSLIARHEQVERLTAEGQTRTEQGVPNVIVRTSDADLYTLDGVAYGSAQGVRDRALAVIERAQVGGLSDAQREGAESTVRRMDPSIAERVVLTSAPAYRSGFLKLAGGRGELLTSDERQAVERAVALGGTGGYAVPAIIDPTLILTSDGSANPFRQISRVVSITNDKWRGVSTAGVTAAFAAEASAITEGSPTLAQPTVTAHRAHAQINYSFEIGMDYPGFSSDMLMLLQDAKDQLEATKFAVGAGDGSTEPFGIVTALAGGSSEINVAGSEGVFAAVDLYAMEEALGPRFRSNASFIANKAIYNKVRQFDTAGGASLWERIGAGMPSQLLGYNAYEASAMDGAWDVAATANNYIAVLGDFQNYVIADRIGMSVELVQHVVNGDGKLTGQRGLLAWWRVGGDSVNDAAFTLLDNPTAA